MSDLLTMAYELSADKEQLTVTVDRLLVGVHATVKRMPGRYVMVSSRNVNREIGSAELNEAFDRLMRQHERDIRVISLAPIIENGRNCTSVTFMMTYGADYAKLEADFHHAMVSVYLPPRNSVRAIYNAPRGLKCQPRAKRFDGIVDHHCEAACA